MKVSILINGLRIIGQYDAMIRYHINGYHLRQYMQQKFEWTDTDWNSVDLHLFSQFHQSLPFQKQIQRMKFVYNQQPLGYRLSQQAMVASPTIELCPCCQQQTEDQCHMLQCLSNPARQDALQKFQKALHSGELHALFYLISYGVLQWFSGTVPTPSEWDLRGYPPHMIPSINEALQSQTGIGWLSGIKGFWSKDWTTIAKLSMDNPKVKNHQDCSLRLRCVLTATHELVVSLWNGRNDCLQRHQQDAIPLRQSSEEVEIRHYYGNPGMLAASDRHYCERSLSQILKSSPANRRRWLRQVKQARARRLTDQLSQSKIYAFFERQPTRSNEPSLRSDYAPPPPPAPPPRQRSIMDFFGER
jgi:hypothetical protein